MKYLETPCTRCGEPCVIAPSKTEMQSQPILPRCDSCGKRSRYNIFSHADGSMGYTLSRWGRTGNKYVRQNWYVTVAQAKLPAWRVRRALDRELERV